MILHIYKLFQPNKVEVSINRQPFCKLLSKIIKLALIIMLNNESDNVHFYALLKMITKYW
jgi:hypothetical protein